MSTGPNPTVKLRGGRPWTPGDSGDGTSADVLVRDGLVAAVGPEATEATADITLDCGDCVVSPGLVDLHTHLREPGREDAETVETGSRAAAAGGFTAVFAMANTDPVADTAGTV